MKSDTTKQPLEDSEKEKIHVPRWLQNELYNLSMPYVDRIIEAHKKENLGFSRFSLQSMGEQLVCLGYFHANPNPPEEKLTPEKAVNERKALTDENEKVKRLLHDLTPGGSEFYNDPEYCAKWVRENREENHYTLSNIIKGLKDERKALLDMIGKFCYKLQEHQTQNREIIAGYTLAANIPGMTELLNEATRLLINNANKHLRQ